MFMVMGLLTGALLTATVAPPEPYGPVPSPQQLAWQRMEYGMFCHFGINTFHNEEWTDGTKDPKTFLPTEFNGRQWVETAKKAGMQYLIVTAKHHDGFSIYPTEHGDYNVKASPWRDGKGDTLREVADACHELGLMLGVYLSPWDRHDPLYEDPPAYDERFKAMLAELLTWYAPVGEVWFDGAGSKGHVYDWNGYYSLIRELAPDALIAICGPDGRCVFTEGECGGVIAEEIKGTRGFGYDPIFFLPGRGMTMAELPLEEKNRISHRAKALEKARDLLMRMEHNGDLKA